MPTAAARWIKRTAEFKEKAEVDLVPRGVRGIYVLFNKRRGGERYDVVYVGLSRTGVRGRLRGHRRSPVKGRLWSHFSVLEVWDNVSDQEIGELEGLFRHIYRRDTRANKLNIQKSHRPFRLVRLNDFSAWSIAQQ
jgi:hypothetical protein